tara:strand:- start:260 stop:598 length:339 start_codon:yes stop_codon:yes gene_type:complete
LLGVDDGEDVSGESKNIALAFDTGFVVGTTYLFLSTHVTTKAGTTRTPTGLDAGLDLVVEEIEFDLGAFGFFQEKVGFIGTSYAATPTVACTAEELNFTFTLTLDRIKRFRV